jgi:molybdopterin/thiamine biosynthesis adenylyltransferase
VLYLAASGLGRITVVDPDVVDLTNLQRQIAHSTERVGQPKAMSAANAALALNPEVNVRPVQARADAALLREWVPQADVVLDCTDNFTTRQAINAACVAHGKPLVSGAAVGWDAQVSVFDPRLADAPCYACVFDPGRAPREVACATMGVLAPLVGIVGAMQAAEALKLLAAEAGVGESLAGRLLMLDARRMTWTTLQVDKKGDCPVCGYMP